MPSLECERIDEKKDVLDNGGHVLDDDGCEMAAVFDLRDGDKDDCLGRRFRLGLATEEIEASSVDFCFAIAAFISTVVTFRFFRDGDSIVNVDNDGRL